MISEPTHFFRENCRPSCIDLIITDQPNLVIESGVRSSLDPSVKHQLVFCTFNFKIPPPPKYNRRIWHFSRARKSLITRAIRNIDWEQELNTLENPSEQVDLLNDYILNVISNFVPTEIKKFSPNDPPWFTCEVRRVLKKQNSLYKKYKKNGFQENEKVAIDNHRALCADTILKAKENFLKSQGDKLSDTRTAPKTYWKIINSFLNKCKIPRIPPLFVNNIYITKCNDKAEIFNNYFASQCTPFSNDSTLPNFSPLTENTLSFFEITDEEIKDLLIGVNVNKAHGPDEISANMIKLCDTSLILPLKIIFNNIIRTGIFPSQWKMANVKPIHEKMTNCEQLYLFHSFQFYL